MNIPEQAAYLKGLLEGMALDADKPETKLLTAIVDLLNEMALDAADTEEELETLNAYVEEIDEDLGGVEEILFGDGECDCCDHDFDPDDDYEYVDEEYEGEDEPEADAAGDDPIF